MNIFFASAECYPAAKVGGLADVVGALPKYLNKAGHNVSVFLPMYNMDWINEQTTSSLYSGCVNFLDRGYQYHIRQVDFEVLGFDLLLVDIPDLFYRKGVYADHQSNYFTDEAERYIAYDIAVLEYTRSIDDKPDIVHCHDHHTALIPFLMTQCGSFDSLSHIPTVLTIHNEQYRGRIPWQKKYLLPKYDNSAAGLLDWDHMIDSLACGIKCCWRMTTVSPSYMNELLEKEGPIKSLFQQEKEKAIGLINGIDNEYWNPVTDPMIPYNLEDNILDFKNKNKSSLCKKFKLDTSLPLVSFIGRLAIEKGADLLPEILDVELRKRKKDINFIILGTGMASLENELISLGKTYNRNLSVNIMYDEAMAHQIYAGTDFLLMPSRVEPCGLNQMYAMRYGSVPIVASVGGLIDTVTDVKYYKGTGIRFDNADPQLIKRAMQRVRRLYTNQDRMHKTIMNASSQNFSWDASAQSYIDLYNEISNNNETKNTQLQKTNA